MTRLLRALRLAPVPLALLILLAPPVGPQRAVGSLCAGPLPRGAVVFTGVVTEAPDTGLWIWAPYGALRGHYRFEVEHTEVGDAGDGRVYVTGGELTPVLLPGRRYEVHADEGLVIRSCSLTRQIGTTPAALWADVGRWLRALVPLYIGLGILVSGTLLAFRRPILAAVYVWTAGAYWWGWLNVSQQGRRAHFTESLVDLFRLWAPFLLPWMVGMAVIGVLWLGRGWPGSRGAALLLAGFGLLCVGTIVRGLVMDGTLFGGDYGTVWKGLVLGGIASYLVGFVLALREVRQPAISELTDRLRERRGPTTG